VTATRPVVAMITSPGGVELVEAADNRLSMVDRKVMATVFWDSQGVIYIDYLEKGKTGLYYAELLGRLTAESQKILTHLARKK